MRKAFSRIMLVTSAFLLVGSLVAQPGANAAVPKCFGKKATIISNAKTVNGTKKADVIVGGGSGQTINGGGGNDLICAKGGPDGVNGGAGADKIDGGGGNDGTLLCNGAKFLDGGGGNDTVKGGKGNNCLKGGAGNDTLNGGPADDFLVGGTGSDKLNGGTNGNPLTSNALGDTANFVDLAAAVDANLTTGQAASGSDTDTMTGVENLFGTTFDDTLTANSGAGTTPNGMEGFLGDDTLDGNGAFVALAVYLFSPASVTVTMAGPGNSPGSSSGGEGADTLKSITGVVGSNHDDNITGGNLLFGSGGNANITGGSTNDTISGDGRSELPTDGNDSVNAGDGDDVVGGGGGDDSLDGGAGADGADGGTGTDTCTNFEQAANCNP